MDLKDFQYLITLAEEGSVSKAKAGIGNAFTYVSCIDPDDPLETFRIGEKGVFLNLGVALPSREYHSLAAKALREIVCEVHRQENSR